MKKSEKQRLLNELFKKKEKDELTDAELAFELGVSTMQVSRWRRGKSLPSPLALKKIKEFLNN